MYARIEGTSVSQHLAPGHGSAPRRESLVSEIVAGALHALPIAVFVLDDALRVLFSNPAAAALLEANDGLALVGGVLREQTDTDLTRRLVRALRGDLGDRESSRSAFHLCRTSGRRSYEVTIRRLAPRPRAGVRSAPPRLAVYVRDPDAGVSIDEQSLRERFGFTPAEARTAAAICLGGSLFAQSALRHLRPLTIRGYVKHVLARTATHSQLDLVRLLLTGVRTITAVDSPRRCGVERPAQ
ncbi:MAG: hypothetical protein IT386_13165 [Deltaproteobacteria bacterium]|nr:hypothetical protein [Deltaproteobacteria bacterium]